MTASRLLPSAARHCLVWATALLLCGCFSPSLAADAPAAQPDAPKGFKHRGFYLHEGWLFKHPFAVRSWKREDFAAIDGGGVRFAVWASQNSRPAAWASSIVRR